MESLKINQCCARDVTRSDSELSRDVTLKCQRDNHVLSRGRTTLLVNIEVNILHTLWRPSINSDVKYADR